MKRHISIKEVVWHNFSTPYTTDEYFFCAFFKRLSDPILQFKKNSNVQRFEAGHYYVQE